MAQIGKPQREIYVEPIAIPVPTRTPQEAPLPTPRPIAVPA